MSFDVADRKTYTSPKLRRLKEQEARLLSLDQVGPWRAGSERHAGDVSYNSTNQLRSAEEESAKATSEREPRQ